MKLLLDHVDSPYIRGIGFLYLRYAVEPTTIWKWIESYLYDNEPITVTAKSNKNKSRNGHEQKRETIGDFVRRLFSSERDFYGTMLPRLPIQTERHLQVKLLFAEKIQERAKKHLLNRNTMDCFKTLGSRVMALYGDDDNPITWYEGLVDRVILRDDQSFCQLAVPKFVVTFPEYNNTEIVTLGEMEMLGFPLDSMHKEKSTGEEKQGQGKYDRNRHSHHDRSIDRGYHRIDRKDDERRGYSNARYNDRVDSRIGDNKSRRGYHNEDGHRRRDNEPCRGYHDVDYRDRREIGSRREHVDSYSSSQLPYCDHLYEEVRRQERANVIAQGGKAVARKPKSTNASLAGDQRTNRHDSTNSHASSSRHKSPYEERKSSRLILPLSEAPESTGEKRSAKDVLAQQEKKQKLMAKYG